VSWDTSDASDQRAFDVGEEVDEGVGEEEGVGEGDGVREAEGATGGSDAPATPELEPMEEKDAKADADADFTALDEAVAESDCRAMAEYVACALRDAVSDANDDEEGVTLEVAEKDMSAVALGSVDADALTLADKDDVEDRAMAADEVPRREEDIEAEGSAESVADSVAKDELVEPPLDEVSAVLLMTLEDTPRMDAKGVALATDKVGSGEGVDRRELEGNDELGRGDAELTAELVSETDTLVLAVEDERKEGETLAASLLRLLVDPWELTVEQGLPVPSRDCVRGNETAALDEPSIELLLVTETTPELLGSKLEVGMGELDTILNIEAAFAGEILGNTLGVTLEAPTTVDRDAADINEDGDANKVTVLHAETDAERESAMEGLGWGEFKPEGLGG
jgi:hypothetical protein